MKQIVHPILLVLALLVSGTVVAAGLDQAKRDGLIGERADGYLGLVQKPAPDDVVALVKTINNKRREQYRKIAKANALELEQVQARAGQKAIERTQTGGWILTDGGWKQK